jgi:hypothetical protein
LGNLCIPTASELSGILSAVGGLRGSAINSMTSKRFEALLAKQEPKLKSRLGKWIATGFTLLAPITLALLPQSTLWKATAYLVGVLLLLLLWVLSWLAIYRAKIGSLESCISELRGQSLDKNDWEILDLIHKHDPKRYGRDEISQLVSMSETDVRYSLRKLMNKGYIDIPLMKKLHKAGRQNPNGIILKQAGIALMKRIISE